MRSFLILVALSLGLLALVPACSMFDWREGGPAPGLEPVRSFHLVYDTHLTDLTVGEELRLWIPIPRDDPHQMIRNLTWDGPLKGVRRTEPVFGNEMLYFTGTVGSPAMKFVIEYDVDRYPYQSDLEELASDGPPDGSEFDCYLKPSTLAFVNPRVREEAARLSAGKRSTLAKARAFYDHVQQEMSYDKNHQGWGRGSIDHACIVGMGNCTDFHTYFTSLCLASGIASRFQIGIYGKYDVVPEEYTTGGYHCWAEFRVPGKEWVPVDISEADKDPSRVDEFFGGHTPNRVTLSHGRDVMLEPKQSGAPLNYFLNPHAEQGGRRLPASQVKKSTRWKDLPSL